MADATPTTDPTAATPTPVPVTAGQDLTSKPVTPATTDVCPDGQTKDASGKCVSTATNVAFSPTTGDGPLVSTTGGVGPGGQTALATPPMGTQTSTNSGLAAQLQSYGMDQAQALTNVSFLKAPGALAPSDGTTPYTYAKPYTSPGSTAPDYTTPGYTPQSGPAPTPVTPAPPLQYSYANTSYGVDPATTSPAGAATPGATPGTAPDGTPTAPYGYHVDPSRGGGFFSNNDGSAYVSPADQATADAKTKADAATKATADAATKAASDAATAKDTATESPIDPKTGPSQDQQQKLYDILGPMLGLPAGTVPSGWMESLFSSGNAAGATTTPAATTPGATTPATAPPPADTVTAPPPAAASTTPQTAAQLQTAVDAAKAKYQASSNTRNADGSYGNPADTKAYTDAMDAQKKGADPSYQSGSDVTAAAAKIDTTQPFVYKPPQAAGQPALEPSKDPQVMALDAAYKKANPNAQSTPPGSSLRNALQIGSQKGYSIDKMVQIMSQYISTHGGNQLFSSGHDQGGDTGYGMSGDTSGLDYSKGGGPNPSSPASPVSKQPGYSYA